MPSLVAIAPQIKEKQKAYILPKYPSLNRVNPLTISQIFISISFFVKKLLQKNFWGFTQTSPPLGGRGLNALINYIKIRPEYVNW